MTPLTQFLVYTVVFLSCLFWRVNHDWKERFQRPEDGHDRAGRREWQWYWNRDRNKIVEKIPFEPRTSKEKLRSETPDALHRQVPDGRTGP